VYVDNDERGSSAFMMSGGDISGNNAASNGGGVFVGAGGTFTKTGDSVIYGNDADPANLKNTANGDGKGHAVYDDRVSKATDTTLGVNVDYPSTSP
jgi:hypothetical protein